jgi:LysR family transcriptional regulator, regulator for genes of the gallate degradation pathway
MDRVYELNFRHLRLLDSVTTHGSLSTAARAAGISQPALTQALAKLEASFGAQLFSRTPAGVAPTPTGRRVVRRVGRAMARLTQALRRCAAASKASEPERYLTSGHVRGLLGLAEAGSFLRAAEGASVSVPSLHRAVRDLEGLCGVPLVERRGRGVGLTRAGTQLARGFSLAVAELTAALDEGSHGGPRLAVGAMALSRSLLLPATLAELLRAAPDAQVEVQEGSYLDLVEFLRQGRIDVMVGALREHLPRDLHQEPLFADRLTIIGRADHPLAGGVAGFEELAAYPWIVARRASSLLERWQGLFDRAGKPRPSAPIQCGSVALIRGVLVRSDFLTLLSPDQVAAEIEAGSLIRIRSVVPDTERTIGAITRRDWYPTPLQEAFMAVLRTSAAQNQLGKNA